MKSVPAGGPVMSGMHPLIALAYTPPWPEPVRGPYSAGGSLGGFLDTVFTVAALIFVAFVILAVVLTHLRETIAAGIFLAAWYLICNDLNLNIGASFVAALLVTAVLVAIGEALEIRLKGRRIRRLF